MNLCDAIEPSCAPDARLRRGLTLEARTGPDRLEV
jgi:hypothetical protein